MANVHEIGDKTGEQLAGKMAKINSTHSTNNILTMNGKQVAEIKPKPTPGQPGNGMVSFNGKAPTYDDLKQCADKNYPKTHKHLDKNPLKGKLNTKNKSGQLYVLSKFEEARRVPGDAKGHLTRKQVKEGNKKAIQQGKPRDMIAQYSGTTKQRQEANQKITKKSQQKKKPGIGSKSRGGSGSGPSKRGGSGRGSGSASGRAGGSRGGAGIGKGGGRGGGSRSGAGSGRGGGSRPKSQRGGGRGGGSRRGKGRGGRK